MGIGIYSKAEMARRIFARKLHGILSASNQLHNRKR
jgi:hypothetical protein